MKKALLEQLLEARTSRRAVAVVAELETGRERLIAREDAADDPLAGLLEPAFRFDRSAVHEVDDTEVFIAVHNPPLRMIIIGAVHIAQALVPMAGTVGYQVTVIDPRTAFATAERFAGVDVIADWPDEVLPGLGLDQRTAVCVLTHDPKIDDPALLMAVASDAFYVGALGSRRNHQVRLQRLADAGGEPEKLARINGPIGLAIGARGAPEIAISILAEVTEVLRKGPAES